MKCQEKEALQTECAAVWESYAVEVAKAGLSVTGSGSVRPPSISELVSGRFAIDLRAGRFQQPIQPQSVFAGSTSPRRWS